MIMTDNLLPLDTPHASKTYAYYFHTDWLNDHFCPHLVYLLLVLMSLDAKIFHISHFYVSCFKFSLCLSLLYPVHPESRDSIRQ